MNWEVYSKDNSYNVIWRDKIGPNKQLGKYQKDFFLSGRWWKTEARGGNSEPETTAVFVHKIVSSQLTEEAWYLKNISLAAIWKTFCLIHCIRCPFRIQDPVKAHNYSTKSLLRVDLPTSPVWRVTLKMTPLCLRVNHPLEYRLVS